ncbi:DUF3800 domain-containing protein [Mycoplasma capricolum subsp. capricolum]|uniref:DUF3800 domain-containing protein n=1 Tax=Mycoplasma capricolum TaxID=2095 RepID=UPI003DA6C9CC
MLSPEQRYFYLSEALSANKINFVCIVVSKKDLRKTEWNETIAYNYFLKSLLQYLMTKKQHLINENKHIALYLDNRSSAKGDFKELSEYIKDEITSINNIEFNIIYKDSKTNPEIRLADVYCNLQYNRLNYPKSNKSRNLII